MYLFLFLAFQASPCAVAGPASAQAIIASGTTVTNAHFHVAAPTKVAYGAELKAASGQVLIYDNEELAGLCFDF
jgi:hypothetical protein